MSGFILPVIPKRLLAYDTLAIGNSQEIILADRLSLLHWREVTIKIRVHSHTLGGTSNTIAFNTYVQGWTEEDPGLRFLLDALGAPSITSSTPSPGLIYNTVPMLSIPDMVMVTAIGTRASAGTMQANVSVEFSEKDI